MHSANYTAIQGAINGGLDTANWASGKIFAPSKIMQESAVDGDGLAWDNSAAIWKRTTDKGLRAGAIEVVAWPTYVPTLSASTTPPTLGSGSTAVGGYFQIGRLVQVRVQIIFGTSGTNAGSGTYTISLPVNAKTGTWNNHGLGHLIDSSTGNICMPQARIASSTTVDLVYPAAMPIGASTAVTHAAPWAWAASDQVNLMFTYEAA